MRRPRLPGDVSPADLDRPVRDELSALPPSLAAEVGKHLVMAGRLFDDEPELAHQHAAAARQLAPRIAATREAAGLSAYATGRFDEALADLRAARRMSGSEQHLPVIADAERGLGRPERALELAGGPQASRLDRAGQVELRIVAAGARRDLGQADAAVLTLQVPELTSSRKTSEVVRLRYAYADSLLAAGRSAEALTWFARTAASDEAGETDAAERLAGLEGVTFLDLAAEDGDAEEYDADDGDAENDHAEDAENDLAENNLAENDGE